MSDQKTLTFAITDAHYENARSTTALRLIDMRQGVRRGAPGDFWALAESSDNSLVIPIR